MTTQLNHARTAPQIHDTIIELAGWYIKLAQIAREAGAYAAVQAELQILQIVVRVLNAGKIWDQAVSGREEIDHGKVDKRRRRDVVVVEGQGGRRACDGAHRRDQSLDIIWANEGRRHGGNCEGPNLRGVRSELLRIEDAVGATVYDHAKAAQLDPAL